LKNKIIYIVDDEASVRTTLENVFRLAGFIVHVFESPLLAIESQLETKNSCILLDLSMPEIGGIEFQQRLQQKGVNIPIVFYTGKADIDSAVDAMSGGAFTLVRKPAQNRVLIEKVMGAITAHQELNPFSEQSEQAYVSLKALSKRELQVALLVADGETATDIAEHLFISRRTVEAHRASIFEKLAMKSVARLAQLVLLAKVHLVDHKN
jgi:FixJ family two-component response regulator